MDIKSLKDKILQLAIQGKLVPQDENDEPASVLLEKIKAEKEQLIKDKVIKKEKPLPEISDEEKSFDLPKGWEFSKIGNLAIKVTDGTHHSPKSFEKGEYMYVTAKDIKDSGVDTSCVTYVSKEIHEPIYARCNVNKGDVLITKDGKIGTVTVNQINEQFSLLSSVGLIKTNIYNWYLVYAIRSPFVQSQIVNTTKGSAIRRITITTINNLIIPIPPLEEQKRIVAKLDELFELIDELDNNKQELLENISNTRNKVLQLAIQGKLVEQCEDDEPASVLLERIKAEKEQLIKDKIIKKEKALPEITEEEKSFELPDTWKWCRLDNISAPENYSFVDGPFGSNLKREHYVDYGVRIIQLQNIGEGFWKDYNKIYTSIEKADELIRCNAFPGELVIAKMNPIARATIIPDNDKRYVLCSDCVKLKSYKDIDTGYLKYLMNSSYIKEKASEDGTGTTRQRTSLGKLKLMPIPLPPQEEQKRIVEKVDLIMNYLDTLQQEIESQEIILEDILK